MNSKRFDEYVSLYLSGQLSDAQAAELHAALLATPDRLLELRDQRTMDALLHLVSESEAKSSHFVSAVVQRFQAGDDSPAEPIIARPQTPTNDHRNGGRNFLAIGLAIAASILMIVVSAAWLINQTVNPDNTVAEKPEKSIPDDGDGRRQSDPFVTDVIANLPDQQHHFVEGDRHAAPDTPPIDSSTVAPEPPDHSLIQNHDLDQQPQQQTPLVELDAPDRQLVKSQSKLNLTESNTHSNSDSTIADISENLPEPEPFAQVFSNKTAVWENEHQPDRIGPGSLALKEGSARVKFNNGPQFRMMAPCRFEITGRHSVRLNEGVYMFEMPASNEEFNIDSKAATLFEIEKGRLFVRAEKDGLLESYVARGRMKVARKGEPKARTIESSKNGINQLLINPPSEVGNTVPTITLARGQKQFLAQIGLGAQSVVLDTPEQVQHFVDRVVDDQEIGWGRFSPSLNDFMNRLQQLPANQHANEMARVLEQILNSEKFDAQGGFLGDGLPTQSNGFRGTLNINGVVREFDSLEEFVQAKQQLMQKNVEASVPDNVPSQFNGVFNINGRSLGFTSPDVFNQFRKQMNR